MAKKKYSKLKPTETHARTIVKTVTYRIVIVVSIFTITLFTTHRIDDAISITGITAVTGTILYYLHERVWGRITWGRK